MHELINIKFQNNEDIIFLHPFYSLDKKRVNNKNNMKVCNLGTADDFFHSDIEIDVPI